MVKFQVNEYVVLSQLNSLLQTNQQMPQVDDINALLNIIFNTNFVFPEVEYHTLGELILHYLLAHPFIKENKPLYEHCIHMTIKFSLMHQESYYLRQLIRMGVSLNFTQHQNGLTVNNILVDQLPALPQCLVWILAMIHEIKQDQSDELKIQRYLENAKKYESFEREFFNLIHHPSLLLNIATLKAIQRHLPNEERLKSTKQLIEERITFLIADDMVYVASHSLFKKTTSIAIISHENEEVCVDRPAC